MDYPRAAEELLRKFAVIFQPKLRLRVDEVTRGEMFILNYLVESQKGVFPGEISETMGISSARVSAALKGLEGKGLVLRKDDQTDKRRKIVTITKKGKTEIKARRQKVIDAFASVLESMGETEAKNLYRSFCLLGETVNQKFNKEE